MLRFKSETPEWIWNGVLMLYLPTVAAWCWLCSSRLRSGSACTSCCCRSCPLRNCSFNFQLPVRSAYYQFIYDSFLSAHRIPPKKKQRDEQIRGEETKQKLDLWILLAPQNSLLWSFTSFSSFSEKFIYRSLLYRSLFCICWFIIFHLRTEQILCKQGKIETQTQEFRCSLFLRSTRGWRQQRKI